MATTVTGPARVSIFMNRANQAVRIPREMSFSGAKEVELRRVGDVITMRPVKPTWESFFELPPADEDFLAQRPDVVESRPADLSGVGETP
ncbi:MAG: type II toxin-antitoxin system VapB family antitoxin [Bifidobacteriaceae bacterium]|jgi:antitoxin VapB|nr:type II toxin-antitoxin system VapB family antitoxin [Bifidobacteriaceae bacterium]